MAVGVAADRVHAQMRRRAAHRQLRRSPPESAGPARPRRAVQWPARWWRELVREHGERAPDESRRAVRVRARAAAGDLRREPLQAAHGLVAPRAAGGDRRERIGDRPQPEDAGAALAGALARQVVGHPRASRRGRSAYAAGRRSSARRGLRRAAAARHPRAGRRAPRAAHPGAEVAADEQRLRRLGGPAAALERVAQRRARRRPR